MDNKQFADWLRALELAHVTLTATIDPSGRLGPVGGLWPKLLAAATFWTVFAKVIELTPVTMAVALLTVKTLLIAQVQKSAPCAPSPPVSLMISPAASFTTSRQVTK